MNPLTHTRILDLSRLLPGPYATMLLGHLGAEVIKVETPTLGDYARDTPEAFGGPGMFHLINRGKKSLALNYRNARGREIFLDLAASADVVIETFRPGAMARWGFAYETLRTRNPRLVYCSLSGYGQTGPYRNRAGHDLNYVTVGGLLGLNAPAGQPPIPPGVQIADLGGGMLAAMAILAALLGRERTGQGAYLDVAMLDLVVSWMLPVAGGWLFDTGQPPQPGRLPLSGGLPCYNVYRAADGKYLSLAALEPPFWSAFCTGVDRPDYLPRSFDPSLTPELAALFATKTQAGWVALFQDADICLEPVGDFADMLRHPQVEHRGLVAGPDPAGGPYPHTGSPLPFPVPPEGAAAPALGAHTREILLAAGFPEEELAALHGKKIIKLAGLP